MKAGALGIFGALARLAAGIVELLGIKERRKDRAERKARAEEPVKAAEEMRQAVAEGDEEKVNRMLEEARMGRAHGGKVLPALLAAVALAGSLCLHGCVLVPQQKPLVLSADRRVVKMEMDGVKGWFVPEAQFADMAAAYVAESRRMRLREEAAEALGE